MTKLYAVLLAALCSPAFLFANCLPFFSQSASVNGDTICRGEIVNFYGNSTMNGTITTVQYNFGDGNFAFTDTAMHSYIQAGMYAVTYTIASTGCSPQQFKDTIYVIDPPNLQTGIVNMTCFGLCDGKVSVLVSGVHNEYLVRWDDPDSTYALAVDDLCAGDYTATVKDDYGCTVSSGALTVSEPDQVIVEAGSDVYACPDDLVVFAEADIINGGLGNLDYEWIPATDLDSDAILNPLLTATANSYGVYTLTITDQNGCSGSDDLSVEQTPGNIGGTILNDLGLGMPGINVYLIKVGSLDTQWEYYDTTTTDVAGFYQFPNLPLVQYIVYAEPQPGSTGYMSTFLGAQVDSSDWEDADIINVECGTIDFNLDIDLIYLPGLAGTCTFEGYVYLVSVGKTQTEDPIPLIDVVVKKTPPGNAIAITQTADSSQMPVLQYGQFRFEDIPASIDSTYSFVVTIPGLGMDSSYAIEVGFNDSLFQDLNFYVDTTPGTGGIFLYNPLGVEALQFKPKQMLAYPNPFTANCELRFTNTAGSYFGFTLFDVTGKLLFKENEQEGNTYLINTETLEQGIYIAEVRTESEVFRTRVMKK